MAKSAAKKVTSTKATPKSAPAKADLKVVSPVGNSGIPRPSKSGFDSRPINLVQVVLKDKPERKIPAQMLVVLKTLEALGGSSTQGELVEALTNPDIGPALKTTQSPKRIYDFYRKRMVEESHVVLD